MNLPRKTASRQPRSLHPVFALVATVACALLLIPAADADNPKVERYSKEPWAEKINTNLLRIEHRMRVADASLAAASANTAIVTHGGEMLLDIVTSGLDSGVQAKFAIPGVTVIDFSETYGRVTASIDDPRLLFDLAKIPEVCMISPEYGARTQVGSVDSRASAALRADIARATFSVDGAGQTVGIFSDSFALTPGVRDADTSPAAGTPGLLRGSRPQDSGDLPATVTILRDDLNSVPGAAMGSDEGAAMAELVADVAPGAALAFHTGFISQASFADGITALRTQANATVLVDDVLSLGEPMYQDGIIARAAAASVAAGVPYFSAAGNFANRGLRQTFVDIALPDDDAETPTGNDLHDFGGGDGFLDITLPVGANITAILQWNQPFDSIGTGAQIDLDLFLTPTVDAAGLANPMEFSNTQQGTSGAPFGDALEIVELMNPGPAPRRVFLAVEHFTGSQGTIPQNTATPLEFRLVFVEEDGASEIQGITDGVATGGPTMFGHAIAPGVISVAAVPWFDTAAFDPNFPATAATDPEAFSARGGALTVQFDATGTFSSRTTFEPDLSAVDGTGTTFFPSTDLDLGGFAGEPDGFPNFFGTSAAVANAAGVAALMRQANSAAPPAQIEGVLKTTAIDITGFRAAAGVDDVTGSGLIDAAAALTLIADPLSANAGPDQRVNAGSAVTLDGTASTDPNGSITSFAWVQTLGPPVTLSGANSAMPSFIAPNGSVTFQLTVTDNAGLSDMDTVSIVVNTPPVANAGADRTVGVNTTVTLDGRASSDPDGAIASFSWLQTAGDSVILSAVDSATPSFTAPGAAQTLTFQLTVTDNEGATSTDSVMLTVRAAGGGGGGGCLLTPAAQFDPLLITLLGAGGVYVLRRKRRTKQGATKPASSGDMYA